MFPFILFIIASIPINHVGMLIVYVSIEYICREFIDQTRTRTPSRLCRFGDHLLLAEIYCLNEMTIDESEKCFVFEIEKLKNLY